MNKFNKKEFLLLGLVFALSVIFYFNPLTDIPPEKAATPDLNRPAGNYSASLFPLSENSFAKATDSPDFKPIRNWDVENINLSAISSFVYLAETGKILYAKNINEIRPVASLAKIMVAKISRNIFKAEDEIVISEKAIAAEGNSVEFNVGEKLFFEDVLRAMLIESSNDAAFALKEEAEKKLGGQSFTDWLNQEIKLLGFDAFNFADSAGLEEKTVGAAEAIAEFYALASQDELIGPMFGVKDIFIYSSDNKFRHHLVNTNDLLWLNDNVRSGKTGYTDEAGGGLVVEALMPNGQSGIFVILGSLDRFDEMEQLIKWTREAYLWE